MALIKSMLLPIMVCLTANVWAESGANLRPKKPIRVEEKYEDLIYQSMKSIVSLDELVTTLSVQVARLTTSLSEMKVDVKKIGEQNQELSTALKDVNERITNEKAEVRTALKQVNEKITKKTTEVATALKEVNERVTKKSAEVATALANTMSNLELTKKGIADMKSSFTDTEKEVGSITTKIAETEKDLGSIKTAIEKLKISDVGIEAKVDKVNTQVAVVSAEETLSDKNCVKVCAGTTGRRQSSWNYYYSGRVYLRIDISSCGYVKVPTITASLEGTYNRDAVNVLGSSSVWHASRSAFYIYLIGNMRKGSAQSWLYNVEWIAVGYTC